MAEQNLGHEIDDRIPRSCRDRRRRRPDPLALVVGVLTLGMAVAAFTGQLPAVTFDPRWLIAAAAAVVGAAAAGGACAATVRPADGMHRARSWGADGPAAIGSGAGGIREGSALVSASSSGPRRGSSARARPR